MFCLPCTLFDKSEISHKSKFSQNTGFSSCDGKNISNYSKHPLMMAKAEELIQRFQIQQHQFHTTLMQLDKFKLLKMEK